MYTALGKAPALRVCIISNFNKLINAFSKHLLASLVDCTKRQLFRKFKALLYLLVECSGWFIFTVLFVPLNAMTHIKISNNNTLTLNSAALVLGMQYQ